MCERECAAGGGGCLGRTRAGSRLAERRAAARPGAGGSLSRAHVSGHSWALAQTSHSEPLGGTTHLERERDRARESERERERADERVGTSVVHVRTRRSCLGGCSHDMGHGSQSPSRVAGPPCARHALRLRPLAPPGPLDPRHAPRTRRASAPWTARPSAGFARRACIQILFVLRPWRLGISSFRHPERVNFVGSSPRPERR